MDQALTVDVVPHIPMLRRYALKLSRNPPDADDLVQDCLLRALARGHQFEPGTNLAAWLATVMRNIFLTRYQRAKRVVEVELEPEIAEVSMEAPQFHSVELRDAEMAIRDLKPEQRQVIHKCGVEGASYEDAASEMGVSVGTIRSRLSRARSQLRQQVAGRIRPGYLNSRDKDDQAVETEYQATDLAGRAPDLSGLDIDEADVSETPPPKSGSPASPVLPSVRSSFSGALQATPGFSSNERGVAQTRGLCLSIERINSRGGDPPGLVRNVQAAAERSEPRISETPQLLSGIS